MSSDPKVLSEQTVRDADLSGADLWLRYFELGGMRTPVEVESYLRRGVVSSAHDHDVLAHALNERLSELGRIHDVRYSALPAGDAEASSGDVQLGMLGSFSLRVNSRPVVLPMSARRVVCFLALHGGSPLRRHVAGSLWEDKTERRASGSLRSALWRLGHPTHPLVQVADPYLRLAPGIAVDVGASEALARRLLDESLDLSEDDLDLALLSKDLLPDWTEEWVLVRREHHAQLRLRALEAVCRRLTAKERFGQAVQAGLMAVSVEPLRESAQRTLVTAHLREGNVAAALKQHESFRELLHDQLQLEPSAEFQLLMNGIIR